jgi:SAM-dependent methyltransferase
VTDEQLAWLCCPVDRSYALEATATQMQGNELVSGQIRCSTCGAEYPIHDGIPHLVSGEVLPPDVLEARTRERVARDGDAARYDEQLPPRHTAIELGAIVSALKPRQGEVILDLGAGTGRLTVDLTRGGAYVVTVDLSPRSLQINRQKCGEAGVDSRVVHVVADACRLPVRTSIIDKVASGMMLEHISPHDERKRCIEEIHRVLRPGGRVAMTVYNYSRSLRRRSALREGLHVGDLYFYRFDRAEVSTLLAGFRKRRISGILNLPGRFAMPALDRLVRTFPAVAVQSGDLLFAVADR